MKLWIVNNIIKNKEISFFILSVLALYVTSLLFYWGLGDLFRINRTVPDVLFVLIPYWFISHQNGSGAYLFRYGRFRYMQK